MKRVMLSILIGSSLLGLLGCERPVAADVARSAKPRDTAPALPASDLPDLVSGNTAFAFDLYRVLAQQDGNLFYSPYSISLALAMTYAGARTETERQMAQALHFTLAQDRLHPAWNGLDLELARRGQGAKGKDGKSFRLNIVNAIWGQKGFQFSSQFLDVLAANYGAGLRLLDFEKAGEAARVTINDWVKQQTEGRIQDLIPQGVIDELTRLVLTNAIYFNAAWAMPFEPKLTEDGPFTLADGNQVTVPMMRQSESLGYAEGPGYQAVELPYDGRELSMVVLLPRPGEFASFERSLDAAQVETILKGLERNQVALVMPKWKFDSQFSLRDALVALGMRDAFTDAADFSGMTGSRDLYIQAVVHKAFVSVDERGTEAAAATAVLMRLTAAPAQPVEVTVDRPFLFLIRDVQTGAILFVGRVMNPKA
jgi:serpin B